MKIISKYWNLVRLDSSGKLRITEINLAKKLIQQQFSNLIEAESISHTAVQNDLIAFNNNQSDYLKIWSARCLRCFISHQIKQICIQLEIQFGREHNFTRSDLFIYTLNDSLENFRDSITQISNCSSKYKPLAVEILETFDPKKANLTTWTTRLVKQNRELQSFLLEQGVYLVSNWAILNDTNTKQLNKILAEFHNLTPTEIEETAFLLESYHAIYRRDRLKNRQGKGGKCQTPSIEQLEQIATLLESSLKLTLSPEQVLSQLEQLANHLREYRIYVRGGRRRQEQSLDNSEINPESLQAQVIRQEDSGSNYSSFLQAYQQKFQQSLQQSIAEVITFKISKFKGKKADKKTQYLTALELFHCQGKTMGEIAQIIGLQAQFQVSRLLKLKDLRADIRQKMLQIMGDWTLKQTEKFTDPQTLKAREQQISEALGEQIDVMLEEAEKEASVAGNNRSTLARRICDYLDEKVISR
ncbi:MAG: hypothetical protein AB4368_16120 [Xenococcaceae cyanobacterium]